jgi:tetratricopeptide (TPR) repeat protein
VPARPVTAADDGSTFTLRRVQALLGLSRHVVAGLIDAGFVHPTRGSRNEWRFTLQDLMLLRTAHALQSQSIPPRRIVRSLSRLRAALPPELPLTGLRITAVGPDVVVRDRSGRLQADSGQWVMDFEVAPVAGTVAILQRRIDDGHGEPASIHQPPTARSLYEQALALEATNAAAAEAAYLQALALAPDLEDAYLNLGSLQDAAGRHAELLRLCDAALQHCPGSALLHYNRGLALDHLGHLEQAAASYERSLGIDPGLADAHFNLAQLHEQAGDERGALRHYSAYRRLQRQV